MFVVAPTGRASHFERPGHGSLIWRNGSRFRERLVREIRACRLMGCTQEATWNEAAYRCEGWAMGTIMRSSQCPDPSHPARPAGSIWGTGWWFWRSTDRPSDSGYCIGPSTGHQQKPRRSGVCVFTTACGEIINFSDAHSIPLSILFVLFDATLNAPRVFSLPLRFSLAA